MEPWWGMEQITTRSEPIKTSNEEWVYNHMDDKPCDSHCNISRRLPEEGDIQNQQTTDR